VFGTHLFVKVKTSSRRQRRDFFGCEIKLSLVTTSLSTQIKVEAIPLNALPKDTTSELAGLLHTVPFFMLNVKQGRCDVGRKGQGNRASSLDFHT